MTAAGARRLRAEEAGVIIDGCSGARGAAHDPNSAMGGAGGGVQTCRHRNMAGAAFASDDGSYGKSCDATLGCANRAARDGAICELQGEAFAYLHGAEQHHKKDEMGGVAAHERASEDVSSMLLDAEGACGL